ncbi:MAG: hypothetical protein H7249_12885 [Chitinophagaceae bacterium]|nr:hypothetical protein [Oligoflexus sp.]
MRTYSSIALLSFVLACSDSKFSGTTPTVPDEASATATTSNAVPSVKKSEPTVPAPAAQVPISSVTIVSSVTPVTIDIQANCAQTAKVVSLPPQKIVFAARPQIKGSTCKFGVAPNIAAEDGTLTAMAMTSRSISLPPPGSVICSLGMKSEDNAQFKYDDMLVMKIENNIIFASTDNLLLEKFVGPKPSDGIYQWDWSKLVGHKDSEGLRFHTGNAYCLDNTAACIIPHTEQTGNVSVSLGASVFSPIAAKIFNKSNATLDLVVMGDNDDGNLYNGVATNPTDCTHAELTIDVNISYVPAM